MAKDQASQPNITPRPPVVVVMGHIDHGKSTLLDYIRKTNVVESEAGGITQHLSAYVVEHQTKDSDTKRITFLDTPGHEAFQRMRLRGADVADVAILIVSAEDGVMPQTLEALECIKSAGIPYAVAINKIDKPNANIDKTKNSLVENEIYIEGMGGDIPWIGISAKTGEGVEELLDVVLLLADLAELKGDVDAPAEGRVIEAYRDQKRGTTATLIMTNGTLRNGQFVISGNVYAPVRIMENFMGKSIKEAGLSEPIGIVGWSDVPEVGASFYTVANKKEAEEAASDVKTQAQTTEEPESDLPIIPLLIKADKIGTIDAIKHELDKFTSDRVTVRIIDADVGDIGVSDVQNVSATKNAIIVGFNVKVERTAKDLAERLNVEIEIFDIIYKLSEWLETALKERTPQQEEEKMTGRAKILKHFSTQKSTYVLGGRVDEGALSAGQQVKILRRDIEIGRGTLKNLQQQKSDVQKVESGEFGMQLDTKSDVSAGDYIEAFDVVVA